MVSVEPRILSCVFRSDVLCSYRKTEGYYVMDRCMRCRHYEEFMREMEEEDDRVMAEVDFIHKYGYDVFNRLQRWRKRG